MVVLDSDFFATKYVVEWRVEAVVGRYTSELLAITRPSETCVGCTSNNRMNEGQHYWYYKYMYFDQSCAVVRLPIAKVTYYASLQATQN